MSCDQFQWFYTFKKTKNHQFRQILKKKKKQIDQSTGFEKYIL